MQSDRSDQDERWVWFLREELETAEVEMSSTLTHLDLSLREICTLDVGDVIPIEMPETVVATVEEVPVLRARFGTSRTNLALKVVEMVQQARPASPAAAQTENGDDG